jgi:hypothetical protein
MLQKLCASRPPEVRKRSTKSLVRPASTQAGRDEHLVHHVDHAVAYHNVSLHNIGIAVAVTHWLNLNVPVFKVNLEGSSTSEGGGELLPVLQLSSTEGARGDDVVLQQLRIWK